jgi:pyridoxamine 5'-phosphate oxidase family protein
MKHALDPAEQRYLEDNGGLGRLATADANARPHVTPVGMWSHDPVTDTIEITGLDFATTKKFRNVAENPWAALVVDDIASVDPWRPRAVIVEGPAEAISDGTRPNDGRIRITPERVISWGLDE